MKELLRIFERIYDAVLFLFIDYYRSRKAKAEAKAKKAEVIKRIAFENEKINSANLNDLLHDYNKRRGSSSSGRQDKGE